MSEPTDLPDRIQKDLEEALRQGGLDKLPDRPRRQRRPFRPSLLDPRPRNPGQLVLIGVALFLVAYLLPIPFRAQIFFFSLVCVTLALLTYLVRPHGYTPRYWRGYSINLPPNSWQERLYRLIYRQS